MSAPGTAGDPRTWQPHIRERYGISDRPRWLPWALALLGVGFFLVVTVVGWRLANPAIDAGITAYVAEADDHMMVAFEVSRREEVAITCIVRARATDGFDVGYAAVELPAAQGVTQHEFQLRTAYRGFVGELLGCGVDGPPAGAPGAQFRPGVVPPEQPWMPASG